MIDFFTSWRFSLLLIALVCNILFAPLLGHIPALLAFTLLLIIIVLTLSHDKKVIIVYTSLALVALIFAWLKISNYNNLTISISSNLFSFLVLFIAIALIIKRIFSSKLVTADTIASSLCAYLLLGFAFAYIYALIDTLQPGSFVSSLSNESINLGTSTSSPDAIYFSFITLLTVGYGDIVPIGSVAKLTTIIEGFFGQIYLVVLIARLVGMHVSQDNNNA